MVFVSEMDRMQELDEERFSWECRVQDKKKKAGQAGSEACVLEN